MNLVLILAVLAGAPRDITYAVEGSLTQAEQARIERAMRDGWKVFDEIVGGRMGPATLRKVEKPADANIIVQVGTSYAPGHPTPAKAPYGKEFGSGQITIFHDWMRLYSDVNQARLVAHEWLHISFHLPDEHTPRNLEPTCPMGWFFDSWTGKLCKECTERVEKVFTRRTP